MREIGPEQAAGVLSGIHRKLRWIAAGAPLFLLAIVAVDGLSWTDAGVVAFAAVILWLIVFIAGFTVGALRQGAERRG
jgi:hypothetical protein